MSFNIRGFRLGVLVAAADLSAKQFFAVKIDANAQIALAGAGDMACGILQNKPAAGETAEVDVLGVSEGIAGGNIAKGAKLAVDANGKLVTATTGKTDTSDAGAANDPLIGSNVIGIALDAAAADEVFPVLMLHAGAVPTTQA